MKLSKVQSMNRAQTVGFVEIKDLGDAQQVTIEAEKMAKIGKLIETLVKLGYEKITITVEKDNPLIIGGKSVGIAIAPIIEE